MMKPLPSSEVKNMNDFLPGSLRQRRFKTLQNDEQAPQVDAVAGGDSQKTFPGQPSLSAALNDVTRHPPLPNTTPLDAHPRNSPLLDRGSIESSSGYSSLAGNFPFKLSAVQAAWTTLAPICNTCLKSFKVYPSLAAPGYCAAIV